MSLDLKKVYETRNFTDCSFIFPNDEGKQIKVHRQILAEKSSVFRTIFLELKKKSKDGHTKIEIKDFEFDVFNDLIRFLYCETLDWDPVYESNLMEGLIQKLYIAFGKYKVESGKSYLLNHIKIYSRYWRLRENHIKIFLKLANDTKDEDFLEFISKHLYLDYRYYDHSVVMSLTPKELKQFLCHLNTCSHLEALQSVTPCKVLAIVGRYISLNKNRYVDFTETLNEISETIRWDEAEVADIIGCSFLSKDKKIAFLNKNLEKMNNINNLVVVAQKDANTTDTETKYTAMIKEVTANMISLYLNQEYTDCDFEFSNGGTIKAHKLVLSLSSPVFKAMFYGSLAQDSPIIIRNIEKSVFDFLLRLIYLQEDICNDLNSASPITLFHVYAAAYKYECMRALDLIGDFLVSHYENTDFIMHTDFSGFEVIRSALHQNKNDVKK